MPAFITHYLYGIDLYQSLDLPSIRQVIKHHIGPYRLGLQGPDIFFYHLPSLAIGKKLGSQMHETKVSDFFHNYIKSMNQIKGEAQEIALAYLCGFIAHNTLDGAVHPYVYSRAGFRPKQSRQNRSCCGIHGEIEACIDFILLQRVRNLSPSQFHPSKTIHLTKKQASLIAAVLSNSINKTYFPMQHTRIPPLVIKKAILSTKLGTTLLYSRYGIRKKILHTLEHQLLHYNVLATMINWDGMKDLHDALNHKHKIWRNPWLPELSSTESFDDLYEKAKKKYERILPLLSDYVSSDTVTKRQKIKPLLKELGNVSYHSGLNCDCS